MSELAKAWQANESLADHTMAGTTFPGRDPNRLPSNPARNEIAAQSNQDGKAQSIKK